MSSFRNPYVRRPVSKYEPVFSGLDQLAKVQNLTYLLFAVFLYRFFELALSRHGFQGVAQNILGDTSAAASYALTFVFTLPFVLFRRIPARLINLCVFLYEDVTLYKQFAEAEGHWAVVSRMVDRLVDIALTACFVAPFLFLVFVRYPYDRILRYLRSGKTTEEQWGAHQEEHYASHDELREKLLQSLTEMVLASYAAHRAEVEREEQDAGQASVHRKRKKGKKRK